MPQLKCTYNCSLNIYHISVKIADGSLVTELRGHEEAVQAVQLIPPDGVITTGQQLLVSVSSDCTVRTWST